MSRVTLTLRASSASPKRRDTALIPGSSHSAVTSTKGQTSSTAAWTHSSGERVAAPPTSRPKYSKRSAATIGHGSPSRSDETPLTSTVAAIALCGTATVESHVG